MSFEKIGVIGAGAWGTALAQSCAQAGRSVALWARESETVRDINRFQENKVFLPGVSLRSAIRATDKISDLSDCDALLMVAPTQHIRAVTTAIASTLPPGTPIINCAKGIERQTQKFPSEIISEAAPGATIAVLSGPSFAADVAKGLPTAITLACENAELGRDLALALGHKTFRPYWANDIIGAQIGGAIKNVLAIAAGIVVGRQLGESARAALITRGFAELSRFGLSFGAEMETLSGLSGLGDLLLTCATAQSRNMALGQALGRGETMQTYLAGKKSVAEGALSAAPVVALAAKHQISMPICSAVHAVLSEEVTVDDAITTLLARPFRAEHDC